MAEEIDVRIGRVEQIIAELRKASRQNWLLASAAGAVGTSALLLIVAVIATSTGSA